MAILLRIQIQIENWDGSILIVHHDLNLSSYSTEVAKFKCGWDLAKWLERLTANAQVAMVLGSIPASVGTLESEGAADEAVLNKQ